MWYTIAIERNEEKEIVSRKIAAKAIEPVPMRGKECTWVFDQVDRDIDLTKVSVDESGELFLEDDEDKVAAAEQEIQIAVRMQRQEFGRRLIAIMSLRNEAKAFTPEQVVSFATTYANANTALLNGNIATARSLINAIEPDETITTTEDKAAMLAEIDSNWVRLGYEP
jgi:hypothetical protein